MEADNSKPQLPVGTGKHEGPPKREETGNEASRIFEMLAELRYARLGPKDWYKDLPHVPGPKPGEDTDEPSLFIPGPGKAAIAEMPVSAWRDIRSAYATRLLQTRPCPTEGKVNRGTVPGSGGSGPLPQPGVPGANNWVPIGPAVMRRGQASFNPPVSGRALRIAIAPGGSRVYVATADGGAWRSDNGGASWKATMDGFDLDPTVYASTSTACGAIAIDPADPDRVYVGTGEGDTNDSFINGTRTVGALPSYHGVGPVRSDDGGQNWSTEATNPASPTLLGAAFYELAVDKIDREVVVAATTVGLYLREPDTMGGYQWTQKRTGIHTFVIACGDGVSPTTFYAAESGTGVVSSTDGGNTWTAVGTGFPTGIGRITLGALPTDPSILYALVQAGAGFGFYRLDGGSGAWQSVSGIPVLGSQSDYNLALIVDPNDANTVYMAGSFIATTPSTYDGSIYRCTVTSTGSGGSLTYSLTSTFIGLGVHPDVHALQFTSGDSTTLWACCDGGVFQTATANTTGTFFHRNTGLATACGTFFTQHPTQPAVIVLGLQDNGTARYTGEECWTHVEGGDGGYSIINWADPNRVLVYATGAIYLATDGGQSVSSFSTIASPPSGIMAEPLVTTPYNPGSLVDAETVAYSSSTSVFISTDFGATWGAAVATLPQNVFALTFASPNRLFVGTTLGQVYRLDGPSWTATRIDLVAAGSLLVSGIVTDIEVDPADATLQSVYITMGGFGDQRHVWYFDGSQWQSRSGFGATGLLDVETNAIVADPLNPATLYVGTDVGVWISTTGGSSWSPFESGLPDSAVFDLQIHPTTRLLRASTYGRGMFEIDLDPPVQADTELYVRDTALDVGRASTVDGLPDPEVWPTQPVWHFQSRNIKVDVPTTAGYQTLTSDIDFLIFNDIIQDGSSQTATLDPAVATVVNRVYVEVHNRGIVEAPTVQVMLLLGNASMGLPDLPAGYESNVQSGMPISTALWQTVGIKTISNLNVAFPQVVSFQLPSTMLPPPASLPGQAHFCLLALLHTSPGDPYTNTEVVTDTLTINDRKVALRNLHIVEFIGTPPPPRSGTWQRIDLYGRENDRCAKELVISGVSFTGRFVMLLPPSLEVTRVTGMKDCERESFVDEWADKQTNHLRSFMKRGRFNYRACNQMLLDIRQVGGGRVFSAETEQGLYGVLSGMCPKKGKRYPIFIYFEPAKLSFGRAQPVSIVVRDMKTGLVEGGSTYNIALVKDDGKRDGGKGDDGKGDD